MKNSVVLGLASLALPFSVLAAFPDVPSTHVNAEAIEYLQINGIVEGNPDGTFQPEAQISRAAFTKIVVETYFDEALIDACDTFNSVFSDVPETAWFAPHVCLAEEQGLVEGYADGTFLPGNNINVAEAAKIISAYENGEQTGTPWFAPYLQDLEGAGAIPLEVTGIDQWLTRGTMAEIIYRIDAQITNKPQKTFADIYPEAALSSDTEEETEVETVEAVLLPDGTFSQRASLSDVSGGVATGDVMSRFQAGKYELLAKFNDLPDLEAGFFYEGWIVNGSSVISTGEAVLVEGQFVDVYESDQDRMDHQFYVLTLEPDDGDPAPAAHILEGTMGVDNSENLAVPITE